MCDFFFQRMENNEGDLADIVRPTGLAGPSTSDLPIADWPLPALPAGDFGDPFTNLRDPLLHGSPGPAFFDGPDPAALGPEMKRPCNNVFSRMLQISPGASKASPMSPRAIKPSPIITSGSVCCPPDHGDGGGVQISSPRTPGIKRRKSQAKKVVCIPAPAAAGSRPTGEVVPSDLWAWRKYGQKPIKGSPYPRGYYRCSSSKGCSARKQVERSRTDPNMLVITYTSEHNHPWPTQRNALAGSTRSQSAKNSSSASKSTASPRNQRSPKSFKEEHNSVKKEVVEMEKTIDMEGNQEFEQVFHQSYKTMMQDSNPSDDFFADLAELEPDPMDLIFSKYERDSKALDPFNMFDWAGNSFGESKKGL